MIDNNAVEGNDAVIKGNDDTIEIEASKDVPKKDVDVKWVTIKDI